MITKTNLSNVGVLESFRLQINSDIVYQDWKIKKHPTQDYLLLEQVDECVWFSDKVDFIEKFFDKIYNRTFESILCGGLGLGVVPYLVQEFCDKIDVVEISQSNIDLIKNNTTYLSSKVNLIQSDFRTYETNNKYDLILIDIWTCDLEKFENEKNSLNTKYTDKLNQGGFLYFPLDGWYPPMNK